jgi:threonylcarbamoyladenosine tRNA methylthiotransferase MtaB
VNRTDSDELLGRLLAGGFVAAEPGDADVIVVNSCCVTAEAERKVRKAARRALREAPEARVVVTGCLATVDPDGLAALDARLESSRTEIAWR